MLQPAIITRLEDAAAVTDLVANRIYWVVRPQADPLPAVVLQVISAPRTEHLKGPNDMQETTVQVDCLSNRSSSQAHALAQACIDALIPVATVGEDVFWRASYVGPRDMGAQTQTGFIHRAVVDITFRHGTAEE